MYALGVGTMGIAPSPGVIQSPPQSSRCLLVILLLIVSLLYWSRSPLTVNFPLAAEVAMVPPLSFVGVLGGGGQSRVVGLFLCVRVEPSFPFMLWWWSSD